MDEAWDHTLRIAKEFLNSKLREIDEYYGLHIVDVRYQLPRTYKYKGVAVPEYTVTATFKITFKNKIVGYLVAEAILQQLIDSNNGSKVFSIAETKYT